MLERESGCVMLLVICLVLLESQTSWASRCPSAESIDKHPNSPTLEINTLEFPNEHVLPTGYNVSIVCTSNFSENNWGSHSFSQPYWIQHFFNVDEYIGDCGGGNDDKEDSKVCMYVIQNATERNSGNYSCVSHNEIGCTLAEVYLEFQEPSPPRFKMDLPLQFNPSIGHKANLTCDVSGIPRPDIAWFKDGSRVNLSLVREFKGYSMLAFDFVRLNDQGKYCCEANNTEGWTRSSTAILTVFSRPTILLHPKDVSIYLRDKAITVNFTCEASGCPLPVISWLKNNSTVTSGTLVQNGSISSLVLRLQNREELPGKYRCIAENVLGQKSSKEAALIIHPQTQSSDHIPTSPGFSRIVWISVAIGTVFLSTVVVSICLVHHKCNKADYESNKKMKEEQRFPHLHIRNTTGHHRDDWTTPRYQMTNVA